MTILNTHTAVKELISAGLTEGLAEKMVEVFNNQSNDLVTKKDLESTLYKVESNLEHKIGALKVEIANLKGDLKAINTSLKWIVWIMTGMLAVIGGGIGFLLQTLGS